MTVSVSSKDNKDCGELPHSMQARRAEMKEACSRRTAMWVFPLDQKKSTEVLARYKVFPKAPRARA